MSVKNTNKVTIHIFYMIVTVQGEREHDEEEDMCQEKEKDRYSEKEMYPDEAHIVKSSHLYLYSAFNNTNCNKALHNIKIGKLCQ